MSPLLALDVALLPPPDVRARAVALSAALPAEGSHGLTLDAEHVPHVTLTQAFIRVEELDPVLERVDEVVRGQRPFAITVSGAVHTGHAIVLTIERTPPLLELHERLMDALRGYERSGGTPAAFVAGEGRVGDVMWVTSYRLKEAFHAYSPHVTLGHGEHPPSVESFSFQAATVAACHLGRFCTCQRILRTWDLTNTQ